jgi:hypothetical protein
MPQLIRGGVRAVSPNGVLGDPAGASAAEGEELLARFTAELAAQVDAQTSSPRICSPRAETPPPVASPLRALP